MVTSEKQVIWKLFYHRTIPGTNGRASQDLFSIRRDNLKLPFYTVGIPQGRRELAWLLVDALNEKVDAIRPVDIGEVDDLIKRGPWFRDANGTELLALTRDEITAIKRRLHYERNLRYSREASLRAVEKERNQIEDAYNQTKIEKRIDRLDADGRPVDYRNHFRGPERNVS